MKRTGVACLSVCLLTLGFSLGLLPGAAVAASSDTLANYFPDPDLRYQVCRLLTGCPSSGKSTPADMSLVDAFTTTEADLAAITDTTVYNVTRTDNAATYSGGQGFAARGISDVTGVSLLTGLSILLLDHNQIAVLPDGAFAGMTNLRILDLGHNQLTAVTNAQLAGPNALDSLSLDGNQLTTLPARLFDGLTAATTNPLSLGLSYNPLTSLDPDAFDGVQEYGTFGLAYTNLTSLPAGLFADTQLVGYLLLDHNQLTTIPADLLATAPSGFVHLDHNQLTEIPDGLLSSFPGGYIDFEDNPIAALPADICQVPHQVVLRGTGVYKATCPDGSIPYDHGVELLVDQQLPTYVFYAAAVDQPLASWTPGPGVVLIQGPTGQVNRVATSAAYANPWFDGTTVTAPFVVTADGLQAVINATASPVWSVERDDWSLFNQAVGLVGLTIQLRQFPPVQAWDTSVLLGDTIEPDVLLPEDLLPGYTRTVRYEVLDGAAYVTVDPVTGRITGRAGGTAVIRVTVSTVEDPSLQSVAEFDVEVVAVVEGPTDPATTGPGSTGTGGPATNPLLDPVSLSQGAAATSGSVVAQGGTAASGSETAATAASQAQATPTALSVSGQGQDAGPTLAFALLAGLTGLAAWSWSRRQRGPRHIAKHLA